MILQLLHICSKVACYASALGGSCVRPTMGSAMYLGSCGCHRTASALIVAPRFGIHRGEGPRQYETTVQADDSKLAQCLKL
mmetsp:Transcript_17146/g.45793  ORF Transcript_17146/g.45793 Transcript_17146/m.45793 type:complete len:81 (+) Transcript_17146:471-713(+)